MGLLCLWLVLCYGAAWITLLVRKPLWRDHVAQVCYKGILRIIGIRVQSHGELSAVRPLLLVSNHISYLDVLVLGSQGPIRFTPKSEIADWPLIGNICRLCECVFIDRRSEKVKHVGQDIRAALNKGELISVFPEATTGNGLHLLPFKSSVFGITETAGEGPEVHIQPAAVTYTHIRRLPIDFSQWPLIAWYGDMELLPHMWELLKLGNITAEITYLPAVTYAQFGDRKALAAHCHRSITQAIHASREPKIKAA